MRSRTCFPTGLWSLVEQRGCNIPPYGPRKTVERLVAGERGQEKGGQRTFSTSFPCQGSVLLMHVRQFESAQLLCLDSLYPPLSMRKECIQGLFVELKLVTRSDSNRDLLYFFLYTQNKGCGYCQGTVSMSFSGTY